MPDRVLVSVGGGGLIAGIASWFQDGCRIDALEPELAPTLYRAREAGTPVDVAVSGVAADSLGARRIGAIAWEVTRAPCGRAAPPCRCRHPRGATRPVERSCASRSSRPPRCPWRRLTTRTVVPRKDESVLLVICGANLDLASLAGLAANVQDSTLRRPGVLHRHGPDVPRLPAADRFLQLRDRARHGRRHAVTASPASAARPVAAAARRSRW